MRVKFFRLIFLFLLALVITYLARKPVYFLEKRKVNRSLAIILVYFLLILAVGALMVMLAPGIYNNIVEIIDAAPKLYEKYKTYIDMVSDFLSFENAVAVLEDSVSILFDIFLAFILAFYLLRDKETVREFVLSFFPLRVRKEAAEGIHEISRIISSFVTGQLLVAAIVGILETVGLYIAGVKYPFVMGFIGGIANIIPVVGPFIGAVPAVAISLLESPYKAAAAAAVFIIVQQIDNNFLTPRIVEGRLGLHPAVTISVVFIAGLFFGALGILLSIPLTAVMVSIIRRIYKIKIDSKSA